MSKRTHRGSDLRDFLKERGVLDEVEERAMKQALAIQLAELLKKNELTKAEMAARMKTSRAAVDRLLDASNTSVTLATLGKAARALGRRIKNWLRRERRSYGNSFLMRDFLRSGSSP